MSEPSASQGSQILWREEAPPLILPNRDDISSSMVVIPPGPILDDPEYFAPLLCFPFHLKEESALDKSLQELLWVIHSAMCHVHEGKRNAYMDLKQKHFACQFRASQQEKPIIIQTSSGALLPELHMQLRIHRMDMKEHYIVLVVRTQLAFSLRHAIIYTLSQGTLDQTDERRAVLNTIAQRTRHILLHTSLYEELERTDSIDWMKIPNSYSFTTIFSIRAAVQWIKGHYATMYPDQSEADLEGFGLVNLHETELTGTFIQQCAQFDQKVDHAIWLTTESSKKKKKKKKKRKTATPSQLSVLEEEDEEDERLEEEEGIPIDLQPPYAWPLDQARGVYGYPAAPICIQVALRFFVSGPLPLEKFQPMVHMLPTSVSMQILSSRLQVGPLDFSQMLLTEPLRADECTNLLVGKKPVMERSFYSNGDAKWARGFMAAIQSLPAEQAAEKLKIVSEWIEMSLPLALTRAGGSDTYTNQRAFNYGKRMEKRHDVMPPDQPNPDHPITESALFFHEFICKTQNGKREGCLVHEALIALIKILQKTNKEAWNLRPDNLFLFIQFLISDLMLSMNFHGSMVQGSENGIGSTLIVHDGGGSYKIQEGVLFTKFNGCGVDFVISILQCMMDVGMYDPKITNSDRFFQEVKRSSEMGLFVQTCNVVKGPDGKQEMVSRIIELSTRLYTSEMRLHNDVISAASIQAIVTSVSRQTRSSNPNMQTSTEIDPKLKIRVPIKYIQAIVGYFLICSNNLVGRDNIERYCTLSKVTRCVPSCADAMDARMREDDYAEHLITFGEKKYVPSAQQASVIRSPKCRGLFLCAVGVAHFTAFMQWTGMLGKVPSSMIVEEVLDAFYAQLELSKDILNPVKYSADDRSRCFEISKARIVATSLLASSVQSVLAVGKKNQTLHEATKLTAFKLMYKGIAASTLPWLIADTLEHMLRMDFMILVQYFCLKLRVPSNLVFEDVLSWLKNGEASGALKQWLDAFIPQALKVAPLETEERRATLACGIYLSQEHLQVAINPMETGDMYKVAMEKIAPFIYHDAEREFGQYCQIHRLHGVTVIQKMLEDVMHQPMAWPTVFGTLKTLPSFWDASPPASPYSRERLILPPLMFVRMEATKLCLAMDARWILMVGAIAGCKPCQAARHSFVSMWVKHFYKWCVPRCLTYGEHLITGLPSPKMCSGILTPSVIPTERRLLGRPHNPAFTPSHHNIPSPTGMIEDLAVVEERYQLARWLGIPPDSVPTDKVSYSFPWNVWVPAVLEEDRTEAVSLRFAGQGQFFICFKDQDPHNITALPEESGFLDGRLRESVRPLCFFDRPGVLLLDGAHLALIKDYDYRKVGYNVLTTEGTTKLVDPYDMEHMVCKIGTKLLIRSHAVHHGTMVDLCNPEAPHTQPLVCTLRIPDDATLEGLVPIFIAEFKQHQRQQEMESMEDEDETLALEGSHRRLLPLHVPIQDVVGLMPDPLPSGFAFFDGVVGSS